MYTKKNTRVTFRSNRRPNFKRNNSFSNNKPRNKGNVTQQYNKYLKLAKEASSSGDRIQAEYYYQFTDHYYRLMLELGINLDENENQEEKSLDSSSNHSTDTDTDTDTDNNGIEEKKEIVKEINQTKDENNKFASNDLKNEDIESIESIPFISKPAKKKATRTKKVSA